jgi:hypothetical protein
MFLIFPHGYHAPGMHDNVFMTYAHGNQKNQFMISNSYSSPMNEIMKLKNYEVEALIILQI